MDVSEEVVEIKEEVVEQTTTATTTSITNGKISFGVAAQKRTKIEKTTVSFIRTDGIADDEEEEEMEVETKRRRALHFEDGVVAESENDRKKKEKKKFVIPQTVTHDWRIEKLQKMVESGTATDEDRARLALMLEARGETLTQEGTIERAQTQQTIVPTSNRQDDEEPDYDAMPVGEFGKAFLRGCGWEEGAAIGKSNPQVVQIRVSKPRPKGLGLGAVPAQQAAVKKGKGDEEDLTDIVPGCYVRIVAGQYKDRYAHVQSMDPDNSSCILKLALVVRESDRESIRVSQFSLIRVSKTEYDKQGKVLNQTQYDAVRRKIEGPSKDLSGKLIETNGVQKLEERRETSQHREYEERDRSSSSRMWAMPNLRVRFVDDRYKRGEYFKQKMVIVEAADANNCELRDERGKMHYQIKQKWLETVIPRERDARVMVVAGKYRGQIGAVAERDNKRESLWLRLLQNDEMIKLSFEDVCEWMGRDDEY
jgi:G patch domain/KOW motif-containing protein